MPFVVPKYWKSITAGEYPTTVELDKYKTNLTYFGGFLPPPNVACASSSIGDDRFTFQFFAQYLVYASRSDGQAPVIESFYNPLGEATAPEDTDDDRILSLPTTPVNDVTFYDLTQIPWLVPGMLFTVTDVKYAFLVDNQ